MKTLGFYAMLFLVLGTLALAPGANDAPAAKQFTTKFVLTTLKDGKRASLATPTLVTNEGQEGTFLVGNEVPVDADGKESLSYGITARVKVRQLAPDKLRVSLYAGHSELDGQAGSNFVIREQGAHCVRTVKPGETIEFDLGGGRTAAVSVNPTVNP